MDVILYIQEEIESIKVEIEELEECGDLENRLEAQMRLADMEKLLFDHIGKETL